MSDFRITFWLCHRLTVQHHHACIHLWIGYMRAHS